MNIIAALYIQYDMSCRFTAIKLGHLTITALTAPTAVLIHVLLYLLSSLHYLQTQLMPIYSHYSFLYPWVDIPLILISHFMDYQVIKKIEDRMINP